jgi:hypothetical protein
MKTSEGIQFPPGRRFETWIDGNCIVNWQLVINATLISGFFQ